MQRTRLTAALVLVAVVGCDRAENVPTDAPDDVVDAPPSWPIVVPLHGCSWLFTGEFRIGGAPFALTVDTGSPGLAVAAAGCTTCVSDGVTSLYTPGETASDLNELGMGTYDGGNMTWSGEIYSDVVGPAAASARMVLGAISSEHNFFFPNDCTAFDGIVGMQGDASLPAMLVADGAPDVFAIHECRNDGTLWLGGYDSTVTTGAAITVDMPDDYTIGLTDVTIGSTSVGLAGSAYGQALVDSGGPTIILPEAAYDTLTAAIAANSTFATAFGSAAWFAGTNCATPTMTKAELDAALPELGLSFGSASVQLRATDSYLMTYDGTPTAYCPALAASPSFLDLGNTLIRSQLVTFDRTHRQLGIAPTAPCI